MFDVTESRRQLLESKTARLAVLWEIERVDGTIFRFTDHDRELEFESETFSPVSGLSASARQKQPELQSQNLEAVGVIDSSLITHDDLRAGRYQDAKVTERIVDWFYPFAGAIFTAVYWMESATYTGAHWEVALAGLTRRLHQRVGDLYNRTCRWSLGSAACGVTLSSFTTACVVTVVDSSRLIFQSDNVAQTDNYYDYGLITWTVGANTGLTSEVKTYTQTLGIFELQLKTPFDVAVDDEFSVCAGCDKLAATCKTKFSNLVNFGGFPFIPGNDKLLETP